MNISVLSGEVCDDPRLSTTASGRQVLNLRIVTVDRFVSNGEQRERRDYHTVVVWGDEAVDLAARVFKGAEVIVNGSTRHRSYETKTGEKKKATEVNALRGGIKVCGEPLESRPPVRREQPRPTVNAEPGGFDNDDDLPF